MSTRSTPKDSTTEETPAPYVANTHADRSAMLSALGLSSTDQLFRDVPEKHRFPKVPLPDPLSEFELLTEIDRLANENTSFRTSFVGGGVYNNFIPAVVDALSSRGEFLTSYTPYQPEVSQGTLQASFEYQSMVARLLGMDVVNASHYDGSTALAEAVLMALRISRKNKTVVLGPSLNPEYASVLRTYLEAMNVSTLGLDDEAEYSSLDLPADTACVVVQSPDFYGRLHDLTGLAEKVHAVGGILIQHADPIATALFRTPGQWGADIATAEGQNLGIPVSFGGPYLGLFACRDEHKRRMPGRLAGLTSTSDGCRGFVLTLNTREQHIRRERATSNICTNQGLMSLRAAIYMAAMGPQGMRQIAELCFHRSHYAARRIGALPGCSVDMTREFFREFRVTLPVSAEQVVSALAEHGIAAGIPLSRYNEARTNELLIAVTEVNRKADIDDLVSEIERLLQ